MSGDRKRPSALFSFQDRRKVLGLELCHARFYDGPSSVRTHLAGIAGGKVKEVP